MADTYSYLGGFIIAVLIVILTTRSKARRARAAQKVLKKNVSAGLIEPASLHPALVPNRCIGIGECATVCPEGDIIGIVNGRFELLSPTKCIGHGACAVVCPVDAIILVLGTERRGVELPYVKESFETNVDGVYIAGELGGMGLIRNAINQGAQAIDNIAKRKRARSNGVHDVLIVGAGPAGIAATLQSKKLGLKYVTLDQHDVGGTVLSYPRHKLVMTQPMDIPLHGPFNRPEIEKEELIALWQNIVRKTGVRINAGEKVEAITRPNGHFQVATSKGTYDAHNILLAIGRRGSPRKLSVEGEDTAKVTYSLLDAQQYRGKKVLVVGGGDSAVEAAVSLSEEPGTNVTISYRKSMFARVKDKNQKQIETAIKRGRLNALMESHVRRIGPASVDIECGGEIVEIDNDYVIVMIGGELPTAFLKKIGIQIEEKFGEPLSK